MVESSLTKAIEWYLSFPTWTRYLKVTEYVYRLEDAMSWSDLLKLTKSITPFNPVMGQTTKDNNMNADTITPQMQAMHEEVHIEMLDGSSVSEFIEKVQKGDKPTGLVQTETDVGGVPM